MKTLFFTSDHHLGADRGGTTPATKQTLKSQLQRDYRSILEKAQGHLLLGGDTFDSDKISNLDLLEAFHATSAWLSRNSSLWLTAGNHGNSKNLQNLSSFDLFCELLRAAHGEKVHIIGDACAMLEHDAYVISSVMNQDRFDAELLKVPACKYLFLHCNYNSPFTKDSQHSLNLTEAQAQQLPVGQIIFAHEHQGRTALQGKVQVVGNPFPSSVADCLGNNTKRMLKITEAGTEYIETWKASNDFSRQDWRTLKDDGCRFIRVEGEATAAEAADMVSAISKFRARSGALVITNAVKVDGVDAEAELELSVEEMGVFDVKAAVMELLLPEERAVINKLLEASNE
jgi:hypothetical protein